MRGSRCLVAIALGFAIAAATWAALFAAQFGRPTLGTRWAYELLEAKDSISRAAAGRRVLIGGGSNALFGIRADRLQHALGVPVRNLATYAGLGLPYLLHRLKQQARSGDVILLSLEYELYSRQPDSVQVDYFSARDPAYFRSMPIATQVTGVLRMDVGRAIGPLLQSHYREPPRNPFSVYEAPQHLDEMGDTLGNNAVLKNDALRRQVDRLTPVDIKLGPDNAIILRDFAAWAQSKGIRVLATHPNTIDFGPAYRTREVERHLREIDGLHAEIGVAFLERWDETIFPASYFFDTVYHLDSMGAAIRTDALAARLRSHIGPSASWGPVIQPVRVDHPLARLARSFAGWEPLTGFGYLEGPYPQWDLNGAIWSEAPGSQMAVRVATAGKAHVMMSMRGSARGQRTELRVNGGIAGIFQFPDSDDFHEWATDIQLKAGENRLDFFHHGAQRQAVLIRALRVDPST
jgi:hypothetical protein